MNIIEEDKKPVTLTQIQYEKIVLCAGEITSGDGFEFLTPFSPFAMIIDPAIALPKRFRDSIDPLDLGDTVVDMHYYNNGAELTVVFQNGQVAYTSLFENDPLLYPVEVRRYGVPVQDGKAARGTEEFDDVISLRYTDEEGLKKVFVSHREGSKYVKNWWL